MEILSNELVIVIISAISGSFITHLFYKSKLKSEQKIRFQNEIGDRIAKSLLAIRDIEQRALGIEIFDIENELDLHGSGFDRSISSKYPAIMHNKETFSDFFGEIVTAREKYGKEVDCDIASYLLYAEHYFTELIIFLAEYSEEAQPGLGCVFIDDIQKWQLSFDKTIIKKINSTPSKLELHSGLKWEWKKKRMMKKFWNNSLLCRIKNNESGDDMDYIRLVLEDLAMKNPNQEKNEETLSEKGELVH